MEKKNRVGTIVLIIAGFALVLCVGMAIGGAAVYGALRISNIVKSGSEQEELPVAIQDFYAESTLPEVVSGALITRVLPDTPAAGAGLQVGDRILAVDAQQVGPDGTLAELIAQYGPGDRVTLEVRAQDGTSREVRVTLADNPEAEGEPYLGVYFRSATTRDLGFEELVPFSEEGEWQRDGLSLPEMVGGASIIVMSVTEGSPAEDAGLQHGDLITSLDGETLDSAAALTDAIAGHEPGDRVTLGVLQGGNEVELQIRLGEHPEEAGVAYLGVTIHDFRQFRFHQGSGGVEEVPTPPLP